MLYIKLSCEESLYVSLQPMMNHALSGKFHNSFPPLISKLILMHNAETVTRPGLDGQARSLKTKSIKYKK